MKKLILILGFFTPLLLGAQPSNWTYTIAFLKESVFYPSKYNFQAPVHPGFSLGAEVLLKEKSKTDRLLSAEVGFYHHEYLQNGIFLLGGYHFRTKDLKGFTLSTQPQLGYLHTFSPTGEFKLENGKYVEKRSGHSSAMAGVSFGIDYKIIPTYKSKIFLAYRVMAEAPFALEYGVPAIPHTFLSIGFKSKISAK
ncbi:MAG: hypothetical protein ABJN36_12260 [Cyclobacteriaceae bacterium]